MRGIKSILGCLLIVSCFASSACAQDFPVKPVRIIVGYVPGGAPDFIVRLLAQPMGAALGQPILVENRAGGSGVPAILEMMNSPADGYTVLNADPSHWAIFPAIQPGLPYDAVRDFAPIGLAFISAAFVAVRTSSPVKDLRELIALAKAKPGELQYGTPGVGSVTHLSLGTFGSLTGMNIQHIPYKGGGQTLEALLRGDIAFTMTTMGLLAPHVKAGNLRVLAVANTARFEAYPDVPTIAEAAGLPGFGFSPTSALVARAGTPRPIIDKLSAALGKAALRPDVVEKALASGNQMAPGTPEQLAEIIRTDIKKYAEAVKIVGVKNN